MAAADFSCPGYARGACLSYGDTVCGSGTKCVDQSATCFRAYTCNYKGFTCKSDHDRLVTEHESLVGEFNQLVRRGKELADEYDELVEQHNALMETYATLDRDFDDFKTCVNSARSLAEARNCAL